VLQTLLPLGIASLDPHSSESQSTSAAQQQSASRHVGLVSPPHHGPFHGRVFCVIRDHLKKVMQHFLQLKIGIQFSHSFEHDTIDNAQSHLSTF
jgi:hypothetical protein